MANTGDKEPRGRAPGEPVGAALHLPGTIRCPGLSSGAGHIPELAADVAKRLAVYGYKQGSPLLWVVFLGGTGTGKSTLFNALLGSELSQTGVERPKTRGPVAYAHRRAAIEAGFPFPAFPVERSAGDGGPSVPAAGFPGRLLVVEHDREEYAHLVFVDTPDLDSVEAENRRLAELLYLLADTVLFVTSQEKYADEVPYQFLLQVVRDRRPYAVLLNKVGEDLTPGEVIESFTAHGVSIPKRGLWLLPQASVPPSQTVAATGAFSAFRGELLGKVAPAGLAAFRHRQGADRVHDLRSRIGKLQALLGQEADVAAQWLQRLDDLARRASEDLLGQYRERFAAVTKEHLQREIRKLYAKYDVLAGPRRFVRELLLTPFRLLGLRQDESKAAHDQALSRLRRKMDPAAVETTIERLNRAVVEELSPAEPTAPLFGALREPGLALTRGEIEQRLDAEQDRLTSWLEETFDKLERGIPPEKRLGIYSTSVLWGVLILAFESAVGGGLTLLDAALDTVLAPLVTKGAVELFAYYEIEKTGKQLAARYREALTAVVSEQRHRYQRCLDRLMTPPEAREALAAVAASLAAGKG
ncbi:MAG TPA: GTPase domain-containing protein [Syntrophobacteria bacterium]|nr:GTPase domain-containing protein [Syntrophobacteria bacterium]